MKKYSRAPSGEPSAAPAHSSELVSVEIEEMGLQGHGIAQAGGDRLFVPFTLPGERVLVLREGARASACAIEKASPNRIDPLCRHFTACGGCTLQHWDEESYKAWKEGILISALAHAGVHTGLDGFRTYPVASRRRATFTIRKVHGQIELGYLGERSHVIVDLEECPILLPRIEAILPSLKASLAAPMSGQSEAKIHVVEAANGLDCVVEGPLLREKARADLIDTLSKAGFIRVIWNHEVLLLTGAPFVMCSEVRVALPAGSFLQAVEACQKEMAEWLLDALSGVKRGPIADLFAGLGAFSFPLAKVAAVTAFEESQNSVNALLSAAKQAKGLKPVTAVRRDLFRNPLGAMELNKFAAIVADPPREGAEAQCRSLAASHAAIVAMFSCNPKTFARDAAILTKSGFKLSRLTVFDQFRFSAHMEIAALFERPSKMGGLSPARRR